MLAGGLVVYHLYSGSPTSRLLWLKMSKIIILIGSKIRTKYQGTFYLKFHPRQESSCKELETNSVLQTEVYNGYVKVINTISDDT